jgi:hypothetical protein
MFGRTPKLPIDSVFEQTQETPQQTTTEYIENLKQRLESSREIVMKHANTARQRQKKLYDRKAKATKIQVGDNVLVKILAFEGRHKIADRFEEEPYVVISQPNLDIPVFEVKAQDGTTRTLHRNNLLLLDSIHNGDNRSNLEVKDQTESNKRPIPKPRKKVNHVEIPIEVKQNTSTGYENRDSEDSEEEYVLQTYKGGDAHTSEDKAKENTTDETDAHTSEDNNETTDETDQEVVNDKDEEVIEEIIDPESMVASGGTEIADLSHESKEIDKEINSVEISSGEIEESAMLDDNTETELLRRPRKKRQKQVTKSPVRRSERSTKKPAWQEDYHMYQIVKSTEDRNEALDKLLESGILNSVSKDIANRLWEAVMK